MSDLRLVVNGRGYAGWKSVRVTRSIESIAGSFSLDVTDRWTSAGDLPAIAEEDECRVTIDGQTVITGYVDRRSVSLSKDSRSLTYSGRDRAAALVDCSALPAAWTFRNVSIADLAGRLCDEFGIGVTVQTGLALAKIPRVTINPGDTVFQALERVAQEVGVLLVSDAAGGLLITRAGTTRSASVLVQGENLLEVSATYDGAQRFRRYVLGTQTAGTDNASGDAVRVRGEATDEGVRRTERVLLIRPEQGMNAASAKVRADWEARVRAAKAETVSATVLGWTQFNGDLWMPNELIHVKAPSVTVDADLLISEVEHSISDADGQVSRLTLVRRDAFTPEPRAVVKASAAVPAGWPELRNGAL